MASPPNRIARIAGVTAAIGLVALFLASGRQPVAGPDAAGSSSAAQLPQVSEAPGDVTALLDGLRVGDDIAGWAVHSITAPQDKRVWVFMHRGASVFGVGITRKGVSTQLPPLTTDSYEVGWGMAQGDPAGAAGSTIAQAIVDRIHKTEHAVPVPAGM